MENEFILDALSKDYQSIEPARNQNPSQPRTQHNLKPSIEKLSSNQDIISKIFAAPDGNKIVDHPSDLEDSDEEFNIHDSAISLDGTIPIYQNAPFLEYFIQLVDNKDSLCRTIAHQLYSDESLFTTVEDEFERAMRFEGKNYLQLEPGSIQHTQLLLQTIANCYNRPVHLYSNSDIKKMQIFTPRDAWNKCGFPIILLQCSKVKFASLTLKKSSKNVKIESKEDLNISMDSDLQEQIRNSFIKGRNWTDQDEDLQRILEQGSSSIDEINFYHKRIESTGASMGSLDGLAAKIEQTGHFSPTIARAISFQDFDEENEEFYQLQIALEESLLDYQTAAGRTDSFDQNLSLAIQLSLEEQPKDRKGKGKALVQ